MNEPVFVDTGGWFALIVPGDDNYDQASRWFSERRRYLVTTNYVIDETLTLLRARRENHRAIEAGERFFAGIYADVQFITEEDERAAWEVFRTFHDKEWSFTDCTSKVVMEKLGIATALAFDQHFRQFGTVAVVP